MNRFEYLIDRAKALFRRSMRQVRKAAVPPEVKANPIVLGGTPRIAPTQKLDGGIPRSEMIVFVSKNITAQYPSTPEEFMILLLKRVEEAKREQDGMVSFDDVIMNFDASYKSWNAFNVEPSKHFYKQVKAMLEIRGFDVRPLTIINPDTKNTIILNYYVSWNYATLKSASDIATRGPQR